MGEGKQVKLETGGRYTIVLRNDAAKLDQEAQAEVLVEAAEAGAPFCQE